MRILEQKILLCDLELNLMISKARKHCTPSEKEGKDFILEAIDIGLTLGNKNVGLSTIMLEVLGSIKALDTFVFEAFAYAYNGALSTRWN